MRFGSRYWVGLILLMVVTFGGAVILLSGCGRGKAAEADAGNKTLYTCSMHPQVVQNHPGNCPICGMKLMPVRKQSSPTALAAARQSPGGGDRQSSSSGSRKIKYYKSTMMLGEISQTPRKDSMGMDMVPLYEGEEETSTITVDPATVQK